MSEYQWTDVPISPETRPDVYTSGPVLPVHKPCKANRWFIVAIPGFAACAIVEMVWHHIFMATVVLMCVVACAYCWLGWRYSAWWAQAQNDFNGIVELRLERMSHIHLSLLCKMTHSRGYAGRACSGTCDGHGTGLLCGEPCSCPCHLVT